MARGIQLARHRVAHWSFGKITRQNLFESRLAKTRENAINVFSLEEMDTIKLYY
jgi:hypothetical protein